MKDTITLAQYVKFLKETLDLLYLAEIEPTIYEDVVRGQFNTVNGIAYVFYDEGIAGEDK